MKQPEDDKTLDMFDGFVPTYGEIKAVTDRAVHMDVDGCGGYTCGGRQDEVKWRLHIINRLTPWNKPKKKINTRAKFVRNIRN
jgi:hypothetical protein